jgi:hypothetical protein
LTEVLVNHLSLVITLLLLVGLLLKAHTLVEWIVFCPELAYQLPGDFS